MGEYAPSSSRSRIAPNTFDAEWAGFLHQILKEAGIAAAGEKVCVGQLTEIKFCENNLDWAVGFALRPVMPSVTTSDLISNRHWICLGKFVVVNGYLQTRKDWM